LHGKAFCGHCGATLVGDAGTSKTGAVHHYYSCAKRKKYHTCDKKNEKKAFLEWYIVEQTVEYVLTPERIKHIAASIVKEYDNEFNDKRIKELERRYKKLDTESNAAVDASLNAPEKVRPKYFEKIEILEAQKADIQKDLATIRIASKRRLTEKEITAWLKSFCKGDLLDEAYQRRIIDLFVNAVYLYDDKTVIYYNIKGGKQVSYIEMCDDMEGLTPLDNADNSCYNAEKGGKVSKGQGSYSEYTSPRIGSYKNTYSNSVFFHTGYVITVYF
jgi:hypothetical protein